MYISQATLQQEYCSLLRLYQYKFLTLLTAALTWYLLLRRSMMKTRVLLSSIFFIADSVVRGYLMVLKGSNLQTFKELINILLLISIHSTLLSLTLLQHLTSKDLPLKVSQTDTSIPSLCCLRHMHYPMHSSLYQCFPSPILSSKPSIHSLHTLGSKRNMHPSPLPPLFIHTRPHKTLIPDREVKTKKTVQPQQE